MQGGCDTADRLTLLQFICAAELRSVVSDYMRYKTAMPSFRDKYMARLADYVQDVTEEATALPQALRFYIDWHAMARDAELGCDLFATTAAFDLVHVFAGC